MWEDESQESQREVGMLRRKKTSQPVKKDWFYFSAGLFLPLCSDYVAGRLLYFLEPHTAFHAIVTKLIEVAEKGMKFHVSIWRNADDALSEAKEEFGHNLEKTRKECAKYAREFEHEDVCRLTSELNDRKGTLYQYLRYGSEQTTDGGEFDLQSTLQAVDRIYFGAVLTIPDGPKTLFNSNSPLKHLLMGSQFDQSKNRSLVLRALRWRNQHLESYEAYCRKLDHERGERLKQLGM